VAVSTRRVLSRQQVDFFHQNGYVAVESLLSPAEIQALAERSDLIGSGQAAHIPRERIQIEKQFRDNPGAVTDMLAAVRKLAHLANYDDVLRRHSLNAKILDVIADLLGTDDIALYGDQLFMKPAYHGSAKEWHQDSESFRNIFPMDLVSAWAAIDDATIANGCLWMVPGSQRWGVVPRHLIPTFEAQFGPTGAYPAQPVELKSGSVSFHHSLTFHASGPNSTPHRRRGYATHYMRSTSVMDPLQGNVHNLPPFIQVRGRAYPGCVESIPAF